MISLLLFCRDLVLVFHAPSHVCFCSTALIPMAKYTGPKPEEILVQDLIDLMQQGKTPWRKEWNCYSSYHVNFLTGHRYTGSNIVLLEFGMVMRGAVLPFWCGSSQIKKHGIFPKKGSKSVRIIRPQVNKKEEQDEQGNVKERVWTSFKVEPVFNVIDLQGEGLEALIEKAKQNYGLDQVQLNETQRLSQAEAVLARWNVAVHHGGSRAFYSPTKDHIVLPDFQSFHKAESYYATRAHEAIHSTGHSSRLDRDLSGEFGSRSYAIEELVAELGSVLLCNQLQISSNLENHAAYLHHWIDVLKENPKVLYQSLSAARKAVELILKDPAATIDSEPESSHAISEKMIALVS